MNIDRGEGANMEKEYDFSDARKNPYAKRLKKQTANEFLKNRHIPFHIKLSLLSFYYIPPLYSGFMKLCETKARKK